MRSRVRIVLALVLVAAISFASAGALFARVGTERIEVVYQNIRLKIQGVVVPVAAGNEPFIFRGRTFVPLRVVAEALGYEVGWDGATSTVLIGEAPGDVFLSVLRPFHTVGFGAWGAGDRLEYDAAANMVMDRRRYHNGIQILTPNVMRWGGPAELLFNLNAKYSQLTGLVGLDDTTRRQFGSLIVSFFGDDRLLTAVEFKKEQPLPTPVNIDVTGVLVLKIVVHGYSAPGERVNLANMALQRR